MQPTIATQLDGFHEEKKIHKDLLLMRLGIQSIGKLGRNRRFSSFDLNGIKNKKKVEKRRITAMATLAAAAS